MIAHYLAVALAKFAKSPFTTAANVLTLALGLACFIAAYGTASWWRSADSYHPDADRIAFIGQSLAIRGQASPDIHYSASAAVLARYLKEDFPELGPVARAMREADVAVAAVAENAKTLVDTAFVDAAFLDLFAFDFVAGDAASAMAEPDSVVLTQSAATRLFGDAPAVGQTVRVDDAWDGTVTGVIAPVRQPSFMGGRPDSVLKFDMLASWASSPAGAQLDVWQAWTSLDGYTFVALPPNLSIDAFNARLPAFLEARVPASQKELADVTIQAFPLSKLMTHKLNNSLFGRGGVDISAVSALLGLGVLTLIVACVNYANLATAQAVSRAKEVGMRKVLGAGRAQVMVQAWLEALVLTGCALCVAVVALALAAPVVKNATGIGVLHFLFQGLASAGVVAGLVVMVAALAGVYPALVLSGVRPAAALASGRSRVGPRFVARILVGVQFASASFLLILVTVTELQRTELARAALGPPGDDPVILLNDLKPLDVDFDTLAARLADQSSVRSVSIIDYAPLSPGFNAASLARSLDAGASAPSGFLKGVGYDYFETRGLRLLAGRVFDRERDTNPVSFYDFGAARTYDIIVDRTFAERLGFSTPQSAIGEVVYVPERVTSMRGQPPQPARIIGVTESEVSRLESLATSGHVYTFTPRATIVGGQFPLVRVARDDVAGAVAAITAVWDDLAPNVPANIRFFDELFAQNYRDYARVGQIFALLAIAAFIIASVGQLGIAVHVASRRRHEIGVRKVLGSTTLGVIRLLLVDFSKPVLVANLLAWPLGYLAAQTYLQAFADRVALTPAPFLLSMALTLAIAWAAVIGEVLKAASVRPADVLRHA